MDLVYTGTKMELGHETGPSCDDLLIADALGRLLGPLAKGLLFDTPPGALLQHGLAGRVAVTGATGPLYLADLLERGPRALIAGCRSVDELARVLQTLPEPGSGEPFYYGPALGRLPLTRAECRVLRTYLTEDTLEAAAARAGIKKKTAANRIALIKEKLGVKTHGQLLRAYFSGPEA